jgi:hypothetical protein
VFAFVYADYWRIFRVLRPFIGTILGPRYVQLPAFWAWHIDASPSAVGWAPHRDQTLAKQPGRYLKSLTVWLPLTDVCPLNGCMYILPRAFDPELNGLGPLVYDPRLLQNVRAIPAAAGSVLAWSQAAYHWGGRSSPFARSPRISIAVEFQAASIPPYYPSVLDPGRIPTLDERLVLIAQQILQYQHLYSLPAALAGIATRLLKECAAA